MMQSTQDPKPTRETEYNRSTDAMDEMTKQATTESAPLYASPWLAFFYLIRESWNASGSKDMHDARN